MGEYAVKLLFDQIQSARGLTSGGILLPTQLIVRKSVKRLETERGAPRYCHRAGARLSQPQQTESKLRAGIVLSLCTSEAAAAETAALRGGSFQMRSTERV